MAMIVKHNLQAMNANRMLGVNSSTLSKSVEKLSSGYQINRAADDAAGLSISEKMRRQVRGLTQASANAQDGVSMVQTAEGALNEVHDMLQRMNELAVKANNGTLQDEDIEYIQTEVDQLVAEIDRTCTNTTFNKIHLLDNTDEVTLQVGAEEDQTIAFYLQDMQAQTIGVDGLVIEEGDAITSIDDAIQTVSSFRSTLGAVQNRLEHTINNLDNVAENTQAAESRIRDTNMASEMVKYANNQILAQAGQAMLAQANTSNQGVLSLLQ